MTPSKLSLNLRIIAVSVENLVSVGRHYQICRRFDPKIRLGSDLALESFELEPLQSFELEPDFETADL